MEYIYRDCMMWMSWWVSIFGVNKDKIVSAHDLMKNMNCFSYIETVSVIGTAQFYSIYFQFQYIKTGFVKKF